MNYILVGIIGFLVLFIIGLFLNYRKFTKNTPEIKLNKIEKFAFAIDLNDDNFEAKIDDFIRKYIDKKYDINISSYTYKEIFELLKSKKFSSNNLKIIDNIFSFLIINKYNREKIGNREEIIKNIKILEE